MQENTYFWQGQQTRLRLLRPEDWEMFYRESTDSEGLRVFEPGIPLPAVAEELQAWVKNKSENPGSNIYFIIENLDGEAVGNANIHGRDDKNGVFSYAIRINRSHRKQGYAFDALRMIIRYGFTELRYQKASSETISSNEASIKLHTSLGFQIEGRRRRNVFTNGQYYDEVIFGMTREEFDSFEQQFAQKEGNQHEPTAD